MHAAIRTRKLDIFTLATQILRAVQATDFHLCKSVVNDSTQRIIFVVQPSKATKSEIETRNEENYKNESKITEPRRFNEVSFANFINGSIENFFSFVLSRLFWIDTRCNWHLCQSFSCVFVTRWFNQMSKNTFSWQSTVCLAFVQRSSLILRRTNPFYHWIDAVLCADDRRC